MIARTARLSILIIVSTFPAVAAGQTEEGTPEVPAEASPPDPLGVWEGYSSAGYLLHIENVGNPDASITSLVQIYLYGPGDTPTFDSQVWDVQAVGPRHTRFRDAAGSSFVDAFWFSEDAVRLSYSDGTEAIMARVLDADAAAGNPFASLPPVTPPPAAEELLRSLEGIWEGTVTAYPGAMAESATAEFRIVDLPSQRFIATVSGPEGVVTHFLQVVTATADGLTVRTPVAYDPPYRIKFAEPDRIELTSYGETRAVLQRLSGLPPESGGTTPSPP